MISRKGQKGVNEGVVGKYIKKDTPPDLPIINVWTTGHNRRPRSQPFGTTDGNSQSHENKFGKAQTMSGHAGKYTPSESVPNLAHRFGSLSTSDSASTSTNYNSQYLLDSNMASHSTLNEIDDSFSRQPSYRYYRQQQQEDPIYQNQQQVQQQKQQQYGSRESSIPRLSSNLSLTPRLHPQSPHSIRLHSDTYSTGNQSSPIYSNYVSTSALPYPNKAHANNIISSNQGCLKGRLYKQKCIKHSHKLEMQSYPKPLDQRDNRWLMEGIRYVMGRDLFFAMRPRSVTCRCRRAGRKTARCAVAATTWITTRRPRTGRTLWRACRDPGRESPRHTTACIILMK
ncbi:ataxin-1 isoform X3 [Achroia grisella]|uniref:ataxin-1 isoform X3 n=1 Tax=Achroia grisella TaxID=688607 RepID=UPI0027D251CB|nr:ataxin-1 isoform X3 [Achroia grisella]